MSAQSTVVPVSTWLAGRTIHRLNGWSVWFDQRGPHDPVTGYAAGDAIVLFLTAEWWMPTPPGDPEAPGIEQGGTVRLHQDGTIVAAVGDGPPAVVTSSRTRRCLPSTGTGTETRTLHPADVVVLCNPVVLERDPAGLHDLLEKIGDVPSQTRVRNLERLLDRAGRGAAAALLWRWSRDTASGHAAATYSPGRRQSGCARPLPRR